MPQLADYGLLRRVGPAENSGLYEITELGRAAVAERDVYDVVDVDFEDVIDEHAGEYARG